MDHHLWFDLRLFPDTDDGAQHVPDSRKASPADESFLWNQMGGFAGIFGSFLLYFRWNHVPGKINPGKTGLVGQIEAAKVELLLSR